MNEQEYQEKLAQERREIDRLRNLHKEDSPRLREMIAQIDEMAELGK